MSSDDDLNFDDFAVVVYEVFGLVGSIGILLFNGMASPVKR
jgi:hypothetical protein